LYRATGRKLRRIEGVRMPMAEKRPEDEPGLAEGLRLFRTSLAPDSGCTAKKSMGERQ